MTEADRERCARVCDELAQEITKVMSPWYRRVAAGVDLAADRIRALPLELEPKRGDDDAGTDER